MIRDALINKWVIGGVLLLIVIACACYFWYQHQLTSYREYLGETDEFIQWWEQRNATQESEGPKPVDGERIDAGKTDQRSGVGKAGETSADLQENDKTPDWNSLTPEQKQQIFDQFYIERGLKPPPPGYKYKWKDIDVPLLDENGNPILHKIGEPDVRIQMRVGFAPTLEEFERYNQLLDDKGWAKARGDVAEVDRLTTEFEALEASVQRMRPFVMSISSVLKPAQRRVAL